MCSKMCAPQLWPPNCLIHANTWKCRLQAFEQRKNFKWRCKVRSAKFVRQSSWPESRRRKVRKKFSNALSEQVPQWVSATEFGQHHQRSALRFKVKQRVIWLERWKQVHTKEISFGCENSYCCEQWEPVRKSQWKPVRACERASEKDNQKSNQKIQPKEP